MEALNSLFFVLSTLAPNTNPPENYPIPYIAAPEWNNNIPSSESLGEYDIKPCFENIPTMGDMNCPLNEHYDHCGPVCPASCFKYDCPLNCCVEGCICDDGYVRGFNGSCVRRDECFANDPNENDDYHPQYPKECGPEEYISCDSQCQRDCDNYREDFTVCPNTCVLDCVCVPPKIRGPDGTCVLPRQCRATSLTNMSDEMKDWMMICNLLRIMHAEAPRCPGKNKEWENPNEFSDSDDERAFDIITQVNDESKSCFPGMKSRGPMDCPAREHYEQCGSICFKSCIEYNCTLNCCVEGCFCDEGYVRGPSSDCIPKDQCPNEYDLSSSHQDKDSNTPVTKAACGPDESISCDSQCQRNCSNYHGDIPCSKTCVMGCVCNPPKIRGPDGDCILFEQCPARPLEGLEADLNKLAVIRNFLHIRESTSLWSKTPSVKGKQCKNPFECSASRGEYSPQSPLAQFFKCRRENEFLNPCKSTCPDTCYDYQDKSRACKKICLPIPQCDCKTGFVRGPSGDCISTEECPNNTKRPEDCTDLEYYDSCGPACEDDCESSMDMDKNCTDKSCKVGCFCKAGLVRGPDGICVPPFECVTHSSEDEPTKLVSPVCPENEYYDECNAHCQKDCTNYDKKVSCSSKCVGGCVCKPPMVRGPDCICINVEECTAAVEEQRRPKANSDLTSVCPENEYYDHCGPSCPKNCTNYNKDFLCLSVCAPGCFCKAPLIRGPNGHCIEVEECPNTSSERKDGKYKIDLLKAVGQFPPFQCNKNERFTACKSVCPDTCSNYNEDRFCKFICLPGCACLPGYVISRNGDCIKKEHCVEDRPEDCNELEIYNECGPYCETDCFNFNMATRECHIKECRKGCYCKPGWVRSPDMKCIRPFECPRRSTQPGREWPF